MKKKTVVFVVLLLSIIVVVNVNWDVNKSVLFDFAYENLEALSRNEGEGTPVGDCVIYDASLANLHEYRFACDDRTSETMIYPCPSLKTWTLNAKLQKCTK